ncbi:hypothetical protein [Paeniglutamicibacter sp.]|uniref:hypothetical protein n=1 Tax=Paeniglutamicibacter sp. TaxID=1934391 RepID=UPI0039893784
MGVSRNEHLDLISVVLDERVVLLVMGATVLLGTIPFAQWFVLHREGAFRWVPVNVGAWLLAILWTAAPSPFVDEGSP